MNRQTYIYGLIWLTSDNLALPNEVATQKPLNQLDAAFLRRFIPKHGLSITSKHKGA